MGSAPVTRFAPSPTGFLHVGGARTALFNWLFARHGGGEFRLRIEDTDRSRSTDDAVAAIYAALRWLGLDWDGAVISQAARVARHREVAEQLLAAGGAYRCYVTRAELAAARHEAEAARRPFRFRSPWRDREAGPAERDAPFVIRLRAPHTGETEIPDRVQGPVTWQNQELDDLVLLRSDGTPTYMLAVVVDDHDMEVTHVIRGTDHLTNAARQAQIFDALGWTRPEFAHIPLIHGPDGKKYSKRHGAVGLEAFAAEGFLPEAMRNYLARLGWAHGDDEVFSTEQAVTWFTLEAVGRSAARLDPAKLRNLNARWMRELPARRVLDALADYLQTRHRQTLAADLRARLERCLPELVARARTLAELAEMAAFLLDESPPEPDEKARKLLTEPNRALLAELTVALASANVWEQEPLARTVREFAESHSVSLGNVAQPLRAALTGRTVSPGIFDVMALLGRDETLARIRRWDPPGETEQQE